MWLYTTLHSFDSISALPMDINTKMFDEDRSKIEDTFLKRQAKQHKKRIKIQFNAKIVRKHMLHHTNSFNSDFDNQFQRKSVLHSLPAIVMLLGGGNIKANEVVTQPSLSIS